MLCPLCGLEMAITGTHTEVRGDESPDTPTKVFCVQELSCRNPQCANHRKVVDTSEAQIYPAED